MRTVPAVLLALCLSAASAHAAPLLDAVFRSYEVTFYPYDAVVGDFDEDGVNDIVVGSTAGRLTVLRGTGDGAYAVAESLTVLSADAVEAADLDGDGHLDLVTFGTYSTGVLSVLRGHGNLVFDPPVTLPGGQTGNGLIVADLVGGPQPDIAACDSTGFVRIRPGLGGATFGPGVLVPVSGTVYGLAARDMDLDGLTDLVVNTYDGTLYRAGVLRNLGGGVFSTLPDQPVGGAHGVAVADVDGDGIPDVLAGARWLKGLGSGALGPEQLFGDPDAGYPAVGDLDGDGIVDVVTLGDASSPSPFFRFQVHRGLGGGAFSSVEHVPTGASPLRVLVADLDGDPYPDVLVACYTLGQVCVTRGLGRNGFAAPPRLQTGGEAVDVLIADATDDGVPDVLAVSTMDARVRLFPGQGNFVFGPPVDLATPADVRRVAVGDVDGDGLPDVVTANGASATVSVFPGAGGGAFGARVDRAAGGTATDLALADIGGDGYPDVLVLRPSLSVFPGGPSGLGTRQDYATSGVRVRAALLDGDARADAVVLTNAAVTRLLGQPGNTLGAPVSTSLATAENANFALLDADGDGDLDAVAATQTSARFNLALGDGAGGFVTGPFQRSGRRIYGTEAADIDGDGVGDIVTAGYFAGVSSVFRGLGGAQFARDAGYGVGGVVNAVSVGDLDGDGRPDVACALDEDLFAGGSPGFVDILRNTGGRLLAVDPGPQASLREAGALWPNPVRAGGTLRVAFTLPARGDVALDVFDLAGRRLAHETLGAVAAGSHQRDLPVDAHWSPGLYWVRVAQGGRMTLHRAVVTR